MKFVFSIYYFFFGLFSLDRDNPFGGDLDLDSANLLITDPVITVGNKYIQLANEDRGIHLSYTSSGDTSVKNAFMGYNINSDRFIMLSQTNKTDTQISNNDFWDNNSRSSSTLATLEIDSLLVNKIQNSKLKSKLKR